eukprot:COSAG01_NODE_1413_length_10398_cov_73.448296_2_plen_128_part_00
MLRELDGMEAQYAFQQQMDMVPLMLEEGYRANGWMRMLLGVRLWYGFYGSMLASEGALEGKVEELCRELGEIGLSSTNHLAGHAPMLPSLCDTFVTWMYVLYEDTVALVCGATKGNITRVDATSYAC